jgi:hypothetical protein
LILVGLVEIGASLGVVELCWELGYLFELGVHRPGVAQLVDEFRQFVEDSLDEDLDCGQYVHRE